MKGNKVSWGDREGKGKGVGKEGCVLILPNKLHLLV